MSRVSTVAGPVRVEIGRIRGSRFVADLEPALAEESALETVQRARARWPEATHHCWAFRLARGRSRSSDDGEPSNTAGAPILRHLEGAGLVDVVCVVTRWYGGTNLGRGGLVGAYGAAAAAAIEQADLVERALATSLVIAHPYELSAPIASVLSDFDVEVRETEYAAEVTIELMVVDEQVAAFSRAVVDATSGRVQPRTSESG